MDAGRWHFLGSQRVELKARPFFLLALRACRPREVSFYQSSFFGHQGDLRVMKIEKNQSV